MTTKEDEKESDYEEEEIIVFAEFKNNLIFDDLNEPNSLVKIIGIDSENPIAEINGNIFKGEYDFSMGTHVFFEEDESPDPVDPIYVKYAKKSFKYINKTNKVLNFTRIFVEPENNLVEPIVSQVVAKETVKNPLQVDLTYEEALKQL